MVAVSSGSSGGGAGSGAAGEAGGVSCVPSPAGAWAGDPVWLLPVSHNVSVIAGSGTLTERSWTV